MRQAGQSSTKLSDPAELLEEDSCIRRSGAAVRTTKAPQVMRRNIKFAFKRLLIYAEGIVIKLTSTVSLGSIPLIEPPILWG